MLDFDKGILSVFLLLREEFLFPYLQGLVVWAHHGLCRPTRKPVRKLCGRAVLSYCRLFMVRKIVENT